VVGIVSRMQATSGGSLPEEDILLLFQSMKAGSGAQAPYSVGNVGASPEHSDLGKRLKKHCHLLLSLRMGSAAPLPPYVFMVCTVYSICCIDILYLNHLRFKMQGNESQELKVKPAYNGNIRGRIVFR